MCPRGQCEFYFDRVFLFLPRWILLIPLLWPLYYSGHVVCGECGRPGSIQNLDFSSFVAIFGARAVGLVLGFGSLLFGGLLSTIISKWFTTLFGFSALAYITLVLKPYYLVTPSENIQHFGWVGFMLRWSPYILCGCSLLVIRGAHVPEDHLYLWVGLTAFSLLEIIKRNWTCT